MIPPLHFAIIQDEIEVALRHNGTGYVALGWRPSRGIDGTCRAEAPGNFPTGTTIIDTCIKISYSDFCIKFVLLRILY